MPKFDAKSFNEKAFGKYMTAVPNTRLNKLRASRAITGDARLRETFKDNSQTGHFLPLKNCKPKRKLLKIVKKLSKAIMNIIGIMQKISKLSSSM